jgi:hypothetical protein
MAQSLDINSSTYAGELSLPYVRAAVLAADSVANGYITLKDGIKYKAVLKKLTGGTIVANSCDFSATEGSLDLDEVLITTTELAIMEEICKKDFRSDWEAMQTGAGLANDQIPPNFETFLLSYLAEIAAANMEKLIWAGKYNPASGATTGTGVLTAYDGILARIVAGTPADETTVAGAFTPDANGTTGILTHMNSLVTGCPDAIAGDPNTVIFMSRKTMALLQTAMSGVAVFQANATDTTGYAGAGYSPVFVGQDRPTQYLGYQIIVPSGFPNDTLVISQTTNFVFGTNLMADFNEVVVVDMTRTDASDNVRMKMVFSGGTQVISLADVGVVRRTS